MKEDVGGSEGMKDFRSRLKDHSYRRRLVHSGVLFVAFIFLGVRSALHAPAFLDLAQITGSSTEEASVFYTSSAAGGLVGTACTGLLFDRLANKRVVLLVLTSIGGAVTVSSIPWSTNYWLTIVLFFLTNVFNSAFDSSGNAELMGTWGVHAKTYMQFLHFSFSLGTVISPFIVEPFLAENMGGNSSKCLVYETQNTSSSNYVTGSGDIGNGSVSGNFTSHAGCEESKTRIHYSYLIGGCLGIVAGVVICAEAFTIGRVANQNLSTKDDHRNSRVLPGWLKVVILGLISVMLFFLFSTTTVCVGFMMTFFVKDQHWKKKSVALLNSVFQAAATGARFVAVFIIRILTPTQLLFACHFLLLAAVGGLWISVEAGSGTGVWISVLLTFGMHVIFPTTFLYIETNVMKVSGVVTSVLIVAANTAGIMTPPFIGFLMENVSFSWYIYLQFIETLLCLSCFVVIYFAVRTLVPKYDKNKTATEEEQETVELEDISGTVTQPENA